VTTLEEKLYLALLSARTIVAATANVNPAAGKFLRLVDDGLKAYRDAKRKEPAEPVREIEHADGD
jgi:hypothetical protein